MRLRVGTIWNSKRIERALAVLLFTVECQTRAGEIGDEQCPRGQSTALLVELLQGIDTSVVQ